MTGFPDLLQPATVGVGRAAGLGWLTPDDVIKYLAAVQAARIPAGKAVRSTGCERPPTRQKPRAAA